MIDLTLISQLIWISIIIISRFDIIFLSSNHRRQIWKRFRLNSVRREFENVILHIIILVKISSCIVVTNVSYLICVYLVLFIILCDRSMIHYGKTGWLVLVLLIARTCAWLDGIVFGVSIWLKLFSISFQSFVKIIIKLIC